MESTEVQSGDLREVTEDSEVTEDGKVAEDGEVRAPTWCTMSDWTCRFSTCMRAVVTTERTSGTTLSLRISLISRWLRWKRAVAECFTVKPSS